MKYYILASSLISDESTSKLLRQLRRVDVRAEFKGFGDFHMKLECSDIPEVDLFTLKKAKRTIKEFVPDLIILTGSSLKEINLASFAKKLGIKTCYYSLPDSPGKVSIRRISQVMDKVLVTRPDEEKLYNSTSARAEFVGNPLIDSIKDHEFDETLILNLNRVNIAVLPAPNDKQFRRELKLIRRIAARVPEYQFHIVLELNDLNPMVPENVKLYVGKKYDMLKQCNAAIAFSGIGSLESALMNCPHVLFRKKNGWWNQKRKLISPVNRVMNKVIVSELSEPGEILSELNLILKDENRCAGIMADYQEMKERIGMERASYNAARIITEWLESGSS
ncbi:MAG: hypothetical protein RIM99_05935 [Cyclobacteriaceae bacterium]